MKKKKVSFDEEFLYRYQSVASKKASVLYLNSSLYKVIGCLEFEVYSNLALRIIGLETIAGMFGRNAGTEDLEAFYPTRPECVADIPKTRLRPRMDFACRLDVVRTDRALTFYENEDNQAKLWDVLAIYSWVDDDIGYVQGMNDICSPMVILLEDEADAFWCFERAMRRLRENFRCSTSSIGVQSQLGTLSQVIKTVDPKLHQHLEELDGGEYLFAFRMLMVLFRREFSFVDALYLWEERTLLIQDRSQVMWGMEYNPNTFSSYEMPDAASDSSTAQTLDQKLLKQYGKFERKNVQNGNTEKNSALAVFLVASVLETKNKLILKEA
ncbi:hypothetical protein DITRI_Ditri13aG0105100 [Diplodiscus trichospermus]